MRYYIQTENGFFRDKGFREDDMINLFVPTMDQARFFEDAEDAQLVLHLLLLEGYNGQIRLEEAQTYNEGVLYRTAQKKVTEVTQMMKEYPASESIQIVVVKPNRKPFKKIIPNTLEAFKEIVEGYITTMYIGEIKKGVKLGLVVSDDGDLLQLPFNRKIIDVDTLVGTFIVTAYNVLGDNISLTDKEANFLIKQFTDLEVKI
jgi:hypothetical protein